MNTVKITFVAMMAFMVSVMSCAQSSTAKTGADGTDASEVSVYYFHFNARCATCRAIEAEAQAGVSELQGSDVGFSAYNLDDATGKAKGKELGVSGQTLLIVKGDKKIDLTREGFLYARTDPEKFRKILNDAIKPLL